MSSSSTERKLTLKEAWPYQTTLLSLSRGIMVGPRANWLLTSIVYSYMVFTTLVMFGTWPTALTHEGREVGTWCRLHPCSHPALVACCAQALCCLRWTAAF